MSCPTTVTNNPDQQYWTNISPPTAQLQPCPQPQPALSVALINALVPIVANPVMIKNITTGNFNSLNTEGTPGNESIIINTAP